MPPRGGRGGLGEPRLIFPVVYAVMTWYLAMRWRRRWPSFAVVALSVAILCGVGIVLRTSEGLLAWTGPGKSMAGTLRHPVVEALLWPYTALVLCVGLFISCVRRTAPSEAHCPRCHYDLSALDPEDLVCPECGARQPYRCLACGRDLSGLDPVGLSCPDCATVWRGPGSTGIAEIVVRPAESGASAPPSQQLPGAAA